MKGEWLRLTPATNAAIASMAPTIGAGMPGMPGMFIRPDEHSRHSRHSGADRRSHAGDCRVRCRREPQPLALHRLRQLELPLVLSRAMAPGAPAFHYSHAVQR